MNDDPKYSTAFAQKCWAVSMRTREIETLDFLSERAANSIAYKTAKYMIENLKDTVSHEEIMKYAYIASCGAAEHPVGTLLGDHWRQQFGREFTEKVRDLMLLQIENEKKWAKDREDRARRIAAMQAERQAQEVAKARRVLGLDTSEHPS